MPSIAETARSRKVFCWPQAPFFGVQDIAGRAGRVTCAREAPPLAAAHPRRFLSFLSETVGLADVMLNIPLHAVGECGD